MTDRKNQSSCGKPAGKPPGGRSPGGVHNQKMIQAAYRVSEEVGRELEEILKTGPSDENLSRLRAKIVEATKDSETGERVYRAIFDALHPP